IAAAIASRKCRHRLCEHADSAGGDRPGKQRPSQAVENARIQERPAHETVRAADKLRHFYLAAPVQDLKTNRVTYYRDDACTENHRSNDEEPPQHLKDRIEAHDPLRIDLH